MSKAAYRNPSEPKSENSNPPFPAPLTVADVFELVNLSNDLDALCSAGRIEKFVDEEGATRYQVVAGRTA